MNKITGSFTSEGRQSAKEQILNQAKRAKYHSECLEKLANEIDWGKLSKEAEEELWRIMTRNIF